MLVKDVSWKDLHDSNDKIKRMADSKRNTPINNSPATPLNNGEVKRPRLEVSSSPLLQIYRRNSSQEVPISNPPVTRLSNVEAKRPRLEVSSSPPVKFLRRNSPQELPTNNSPATPFKNVEAPRHQLEVSSSPPVLFPRRNQQPSSSEGVGEMWTSFFTEINNGDGGGNATSIWDEHFPFGDLIDKHFIHEKVKEMELERVLKTSLTDSIRASFLLRVIGKKFADAEKENKAYVGEIAELKKKVSEYEKNYANTEKENKAYVGEITELKKKVSEYEKNCAGLITEMKKKLAEYEKNMAQMSSLTDELIKLKKTLDESNLEKNQLIAIQKELMEENSKSKVKLLIKEDAHNVTVGKLRAEIEELKGEIPLQYKSGYDKALKQVVFFVSGLKP